MKMIQILTAVTIAFSASTVLANSDCASRSQAGRFANTNPKPQVKQTQTKSQSIKTVRATR